ncbi:MAG: hypothetical protein IPH45_18745 [Bacteroidales bacterium]|nr:hypothetical protein [Bacteroidales bacterium]
MKTTFLIVTILVLLVPNKELVVIDVLAADVYAKQHIKGAINILTKIFINRVDKRDSLRMLLNSQKYLAKRE